MDKAETVIETYLAHVEERDKPKDAAQAPALESLVHASDALAQQLMECVSQVGLREFGLGFKRGRVGLAQQLMECVSQAGLGEFGLGFTGGGGGGVGWRSSWWNSCRR